MTAHNTIYKIKTRLFELNKELTEKKENLKEYIQRLKDGDFNRLEVTITTPKKETSKVYDLENLKFFEKIKYRSVLKKELKECEKTLKTIEGMIEETNIMFNRISSYTFVKPVLDINELYYKLILFDEKANLELTLTEIIDVLLLAIYETGKYYQNHPKELAKTKEQSEILMTAQEKINYDCIIGCTKIYEFIDCDANIIPKISFEELLRLLNSFLYKDILNNSQISKSFKEHGYKAYELSAIEEILKKKYDESKVAYDKKIKKEQIIKEEITKKYNKREEELRDNKRRYFEEMQALKELSKYYIDKKIINKYEDLKEFNNLLEKAGLSEVERKLIFNSMKKYVEEDKTEKIIPNILKDEYQKKIFKVAQDTDDEILKFYLDEILTADSMWEASNNEEKQELLDYVDEMIKCISCIIKNKKEVRQLILNYEE